MYARILGIVCLTVVAAAALASTPGVAELEAQLAEAERQGISGPEIQMLRQMLEAVKEDDARQQDWEAGQAPESEAPAAAQAPESIATDNDELNYVNASGETVALAVDKAARPDYAGVYANEYQDPAVADYRYTLRTDGSAVLEHRRCENCTHELSGERMADGFQVEYQAFEWAPMVVDTGAPRLRSITDMNGNRFEGRLLIVTLDGGRVMSLTHYQDANGAALAGPHGVPRYRQ